MTALAITYALMFAALAWLIAGAREGYEDADGFHPGPEPTHEPSAPAGLDRATHRALVEAGYAPLDEYLARFEPVDCGGCAPPVLASVMKAHRRDDAAASGLASFHASGDACG